jgi:hypothetical protein
MSMVELSTKDIGLLLVGRDLVPIGPQLIDCLFELFGANAKDGSPAALFLFDFTQTGRNQAGVRGSPIPENDSRPRFVLRVSAPFPPLFQSTYR